MWQSWSLIQSFRVSFRAFWSNLWAFLSQQKLGCTLSIFQEVYPKLWDQVWKSFQRCLLPIQHNAKFIQGTSSMCNEGFLLLQLDQPCFRKFKWCMAKWLGRDLLSWEYHFTKGPLCFQHIFDPHIVWPWRYQERLLRCSMTRKTHWKRFTLCFSRLDRVWLWFCLLRVCSFVIQLQLP